ncbi:MAG: tyrosine-type recombinase/integrase [Nitrospirae bacterium]|nr:tyrosine-type recombinase/integrase [Nitrospirota bacterium]
MTATIRVPAPSFSSPLASALLQFLKLKRAAGYRYQEEGRALYALDRFLAQTLAPSDPVITLAIVRAFVARRGEESETTRAHRLSLIRQVCLFLAMEEPRTAIPGKGWLRIQRRGFVPRILSLEEGGRFLDACGTLPRSHCSPLRGTVLGTALVLLYLTGLRAGELLRLTDADVDLATKVMHIRDSKFGKSRLVPIADDVADRLRRCRTEVARHFGTRGPDDPFFPAPSGHLYSISALRAAFHDVLSRANIPRHLGGRSLRLHDLRHSFAVLRLVLWVRRHADLGPRLPALATYLGHVGMASSQRYLQTTEDLLHELVSRHEVRFGHLIDDGGRP